MFDDPARPWGIYLIAAALFFNGLATGEEARPRLAFVECDQGGYPFDTGVLRGTLCPKGKPQGLSSVTHIPTGARLDRGAGVFSFYRVFTTNKRYGTAAWDWSGSSSNLLPDGAVRVTWSETPDRPFALTALYRWKDPQTLDLETTVKAVADLGKFEVFVASYFDEAFPSPFAYVAENPESQGKPGFLAARKSGGDWQMFPRESQVVFIIRDGRWKIEPNPVDWAIRPHLAAPVALRRDATHGLIAIVMSPPADCFAIAMPYDGESHYSLYPSLLGRDIRAGETATAHIRLIITKAISDEEIVALYKRYLGDRSGPVR